MWNISKTPQFIVDINMVRADQATLSSVHAGTKSTQCTLFSVLWSGKEDHQRDPHRHMLPECRLPLRGHWKFSCVAATSPTHHVRKNAESQQVPATGLFCRCSNPLASNIILPCSFSKHDVFNIEEGKRKTSPLTIFLDHSSRILGASIVAATSGTPSRCLPNISRWWKVQDIGE